MSRIGKLPVAIPKGVEVKTTRTSVAVKGPKGTLNVDHGGRVEVTASGAEVLVRRFDDGRQSKAFHGLYQRLIRNSVLGVTQGFTKELEIQGIGFKAAVEGKRLTMALGYSHPVHFEIPADIKITTPKPTQILIEGADKQRVGQVAANIRALRPPDSYQGKGIRYAGERVVLKEGKKSTK